MKLSVALTLFAAQLATAHYTFPDLIANNTVSSDWQYVRITANHYSNGPVTDVTSDAIRCYELDSTSAGQTGTATVAAGSTVGFKADNTMGHPGYFSAYMTPASPAANSNQAGLGKTWFKIWEWSPTFSPSTGLVFASENIQQFTFTIPKNVPSGQYLIRGEQIALHVASSVGGAQFYIGCAQVNVINGGSGKPSPTVSFPGAYSATDPGILINIYSLPSNYTGYKAPGPAVWSG
ncbi:hypothetical protein NP233_g815 [Leucocoprinus birnbaumii]|uniref:lytic cellulose monooxygenase (C4-dehydrogenating) n=1 Tax=Leucocoprinus birnbaumii TaxID=56174 RepID=A0AAD5W3V0_9AGAR|nr:hypothetical protein NP233_g815 [Leucocoprinus birnbaumii]